MRQLTAKLIPIFYMHLVERAYNGLPRSVIPL